MIPKDLNLTQEDVIELAREFDLPLVDDLSDDDVLALARNLPTWMQDELTESDYDFSSHEDVLDYARAFLNVTTEDPDLSMVIQLLKERHSDQHLGHLINCNDHICHHLARSKSA